MENIATELAALDWEKITSCLHEKGYSLVPHVMPEITCNQLVNNYDNADLYRKKITMERYRFGIGEYKYFGYPLPNIIQQLRENVYPKLAPVANTWMNALRMDKQFPSSFLELQNLCHENKQNQPTVLILRYGKGGFNTLHQDLYGDIFFPFQMVLFLNEPNQDYKGGEFVLTQQIPRAQSKAIVLTPKKGDMLIFTTNFRPIKGSKGYYRANMKHGVSEVHQGTRHALGIIFHDALS